MALAVSAPPLVRSEAGERWAWEVLGFLSVAWLAYLLLVEPTLDRVKPKALTLAYGAAALLFYLAALKVAREAMEVLLWEAKRGWPWPRRVALAFVAASPLGSAWRLDFTWPVLATALLLLQCAWASLVLYTCWLRRPGARVPPESST